MYTVSRWLMIVTIQQARTTQKTIWQVTVHESIIPSLPICCSLAILAELRWSRTIEEVLLHTRSHGPMHRVTNIAELT